ncbi:MULTISPECIES: serine/threonine protein kinase [Streptomyces]|uniref:Serine/threonine-protein kinase AfsK n=1 Tax=Streptomyces coelicolor (strain ATCC BAA-471 / A3(2) / M145) TaxID=100226 RepID=Q9KYP5_STRCO|nr:MULTISPECIES: serine/threonine-protein kinase [Streptomyces]MDX2925600.1 protein kinase [Streptomyces sp. NRRL_B-16638]MYU44007.1 protein kinase [Streptomyces sp. SID7813]NSL81684.1 protein kinase [Streptomyces coelicolor]QFI44432.1 protein kinase [Streptomyces coelicolor A3(2)]QKN68061.1 protein kinase [Streptomyces coelicolor]
MSGEAGSVLTGSGAEPLEDDDPRRIGPIPLLGRLGAGGMGRVYLGVHEGRYAAVKQVLPSVAGEDKDFLRRFGHELDNLARLPEEATAPLLAGDREARPPWFATAYVPGLTLREAVDLHGPLPAEALWLVLREAATGLAAVHALDMVHRDLKPSNVMLTLDGLTLIDFGVARAADQSQLTRTGMVVGTPAYMSPEQASGKRASSGVVDVFALGSVIAYAASGRPPFGDESGHAVLYRIVHEEPDLQPLRDLDPELADVVASCLDKDHEGRPTAAELVERAAAHGPSAAAPWPQDITERLSERAAFAAREPVHPPSGPDAPAPPPPSASAPVVTGGRPEKRERRRRTKVLAFVIPVTVTGATLGFTLLPYAMNDADQDGNAAAPPAATATAAPGPAASATGPSASASPSPDGGKKDGQDKDKDKDRKQGQDGDGGAPGGGGSGDAAAAAQGASGGGSDSGASGSGGSSGGGGSSGAGGTSDSGTSAGSGSGSGADGDTGAGSEGGGSASDSFMLKNGSSGKCMYVGTPVDDGACSGDVAVFRFQSTSGGAFRILNVGTAQCIHSRSANAWLVKDTCGSFGGEWQEGASGSLRNLNTGGCLDLNRRASMIGLTTTTCTGSDSQRWTRT